MPVGNLPFTRTETAEKRSSISENTWKQIKNIPLFQDASYFKELEQLFEGSSKCANQEDEYKFIQDKSELSFYVRTFSFGESFERYDDIYRFVDTSIDPAEKISGSEINFPGMVKVYIGQAPLLQFIKEFFQFLKKKEIVNVVAIGPKIENSNIKIDSYFHFENEEEILDKREAFLQKVSSAHLNLVHSYTSFGYKKINESCDFEKMEQSLHSWVELQSLTSNDCLYLHHLPKWLDQHVTSAEQLFEMVKEIYAYQKNKTAPLFIHCSAGIGRSGVFFLAYYYFGKWINREDLELTPVQAVLLLRAFRPRMVKSVEEYKLLCQFVDLLKKP